MLATGKCRVCCFDRSGFYNKNLRAPKAATWANSKFVALNRISRRVDIASCTTQHCLEMERFSYRKHQAQFRAACDWLSSLGVSIAATRAAEYAWLLGKIADHHEAGTIGVLLAEYGRVPIFNAMSEASEFVHIHAGLASRADDAMIKNLREFVTGASMLMNETPKNSRSRNVGFELSVGAAAAQCGLPVHFEQPADLSITVEPHSVAVECKRPFTPAKVENNVRKGLHQLRKRYEAA